MDIYLAFFSLKNGVSDMEFANRISEYMNHMKDLEKISGWRLLRRKLGLGPEDLGEFHLMIEVKDLAQLDEAFGLIASRSGTVELKHHAVNSMIDHVRFALYRDFPDSVRVTGGEKF